MNQQLSGLLPIILLVVVFYFLILRPQRKRSQAMAQTLRALEPGTRVMLTSGMFGTVVTVGDNQAVLEISPGVHLSVLKQAVARVVAEGEEEFDITDEVEEGELDGPGEPGVEPELGGPTATDDVAGTGTGAHAVLPRDPDGPEPDRPAR